MTREEKLEKALRAALKMRRRMTNFTEGFPWGKYMDVLIEDVEAFDKTIEELKNERD